MYLGRYVVVRGKERYLVRCSPAQTTLCILASREIHPKWPSVQVNIRLC